MTKLRMRVSFYTRYGKGSKEASPIMVRVSIDGKRTSFGQLPLTVTPSDFDNGRARRGTPNAEQVNQALANVEARLSVYAEELSKRNALTLENLKSAYLGEKAPSKYISSLFEEYVGKESKRVEAGLLTKGTFNRYKRFVSTFFSYIATQRKRKDLLLTEITEDLLEDFLNHLECVCGYNHNTAIKYLRFVVSSLNYAKTRGYIPNNPVAALSYVENPSDRGYLTTEELRLIEKVELKSHLSIVRDVFLFSCYTGISYKDVFNLTERNLITNKGTQWLVFRRQKTSQLSQIFLLDKALNIIKKYESERPIDGRLLPVFCNQVINRDLKKISDKCGITKNLSYHLARHTFATLSLTYGVSMETVSKTLGHSSIRTTQIYARILPQKMEAELSHLNGVL